MSSTAYEPERVPGLSELNRTTSSRGSSDEKNLAKEGGIQEDTFDYSAPDM